MFALKIMDGGHGTLTAFAMHAWIFALWSAVPRTSTRHSILTIAGHGGARNPTGQGRAGGRRREAGGRGGRRGSRQRERQQAAQAAGAAGISRQEAAGKGTGGGRRA